LLSGDGEIDNDYEDEQESTPRRRAKRKSAKAATPGKKPKIEDGAGESIVS